MTTITTPGGTPSVIYNLSGKTIQSINASGTTQGAGTSIVTYSEFSVLLVTASSSPDEQAIVLPTAPSIGDVVEIYNVSDVGVRLFPGGSDTIAGSTAYVQVDKGGGRRVIRTGAATWDILK
jgi:hypothetical protein